MFPSLWNTKALKELRGGAMKMDITEKERFLNSHLASLLFVLKYEIKGETFRWEVNKWELKFKMGSEVISGPLPLTLTPLSASPKGFQPLAYLG